MIASPARNRYSTHNVTNSPRGKLRGRSLQGIPPYKRLSFKQVISETAMQYQIWCVIVIIGTTLAAIMIPLHLVMGMAPDRFAATADSAIAIIFGADFFIHLFRRRSWQRHPKQSNATWLYSQGWVAFDLIAAIPWEFLTGFPYLRLLRLAKLIRIAHLLRQQRQIEMQLGSYLRLGRFIFWLGLIAHWLTCGWLALGGSTSPNGQGTTYIHALYWCVTTLTTVGYGDVTPETNLQMIYTMVVMVLGVGMYGYVIGNVANMLANIDLARTHYLSTMERLSTFMRYRNIPPPLQRRVYEYYSYLWQNRLGYDESEVLSELPPSLQTEVSLVLKRDFIEKVPFLHGASDELVRDIALELRPVVYTPGDYIFRAGEIGRHMYFVSRGTVEVISADGRTIYNTLEDGDFFGEIALLYSQPRSAGVRALGYCDLYTLDKTNFERVLAHYPDFAAHMQTMAEQRQSNSE